MKDKFCEQYQKKARSTAVYPDQGQNKIYPFLGLMGEIGEVSEKLKKMIRDDEGILTDQRRDKICKEIGDVLWYVSAMCLEFDFKLENLARDSESITDDHTYNVYQEIIETQVSMGIIAMNVNDCIAENCQKSCDHTTPVYSCLKRIFFHIRNICEQLDLDILFVASENIDKLLSRKKRGVLGGDGDNR